MSIEYLLDCEYEDLRERIVRGDSFILETLADRRMKLKLINPESKYELIWLSQQMPDTAALVLFDEGGLEILSKSRDLTAKMNAIMTCGKSYVNELLTKDKFCELILANFNELSTYLRSFEVDGAVNFAKYVQNNHSDLLQKTLLSFSVRYQKDIISKLDLPFELKKVLIVKAAGSAAEYLLNQDPGFVHLADYKYEELLNLFSNKCLIPSSYLSDKELMNKIITIESVKDYRFLINNLSRNNDCSEIVRARKNYYNNEISSFNTETRMLNRYYQCFLEVCGLIDEEDIDYDKLESIYHTYFNFFGSGIDEWNIRRKIGEYYSSKNKQGLEEFLINESNLQLSNMIIDYHFEDIPFNFFLDIKQLLHFQQNEGRTLDDEYLSIYSRLLNIDNLTYEEKLELHNRLSKEDFVSKHYDVFRAAKDKYASLIKEKMLTPKTVQQYYDKTWSDYCGVPVYILDGQDFYAFVKSTFYSKNAPLVPSQMISTVDGGSYSLDGSAKLNTYKDPRTIYNLIFGDFPIDQIVHMYPVDSYSKYIRASESKATSRVNELYTPSELVERSMHYNEIILAQQNTTRRGDELNDNLGLPTLMGIYCYDEITEMDVISAKNLGVGIVLVKTKSYEVNKDNRLSMMETLMPAYSQRYAESIDYLSKIHEDDMVSRRKM